DVRDLEHAVVEPDGDDVRVGSGRLEGLGPEAADDRIRLAVESDLAVRTRIPSRGVHAPRGADWIPWSERPRAGRVEPGIRGLALPDLADPRGDRDEGREQPRRRDRKDDEEHDQGEHPGDVQEGVPRGG